MVLTNGRYEFDWADFEAKIQDCRMWMFCNPQNPEGRCFTEEELRKAGEICEKYGVVSHVKTQLPYALTFAAIAVVIYLVLGFVM